MAAKKTAVPSITPAQRKKAAAGAARKRGGAESKTAAKPVQRATVDKTRVEQGRTDPKSLTAEQRQALVDGKHVAAGLSGAALARFVETGETGVEQVAAAKAAREAKERTVTASGEPRQRNGVMAIMPALMQVLPGAKLPVAEIAELVTELRGKPTSVGTLGSYLRDGDFRKDKDGLWTVA